MENHLLSIFPLQGMSHYARVSCIALTETAEPCAEPYLSSREDLLRTIARCFAQQEATVMRDELDAGVAVQVAVTDEVARAFGFQPNLN